MAKKFRQRIAQAEAMARADLLGLQPEVLIYLPSIFQLDSRMEIENFGA